MPDFLSFHDNERTVAHITAVVDERVAARRVQNGRGVRFFPSYGSAATLPPLPAHLPQAMNLHHHLRQVNNLYPQTPTEPLLASSPATRMPLLGRLWVLIRQQAHSLVLFYVNRTAAHQILVNGHLVQAINDLTTLVQQQQERLAELEAKNNEQ